MRRVVLPALAVLLLGGGIVFSMEQTVEPIVPSVEQEVEPIGPGGEQQVVSGVGVAGEQEIQRQEPRTETEKSISVVGKVVTGVTAAAVSLGATAAMLMFL
jgi:hypothetical protein